MSLQKEYEKALIKGPKKTMNRLSTELIDELAKEGIARIEGLGTFRRSGSSFEFIPEDEVKLKADSKDRVTTKIVDLTEKHEPYWLNNTASEKRARIPNAGQLELSDVHIPSGRDQQRILQDRYEKHKERQLADSRKKKLKNYRVAFGIAAVVAIGILSTPLWLADDLSESRSGAEELANNEGSQSSIDDGNTLTVSTTLIDPSDVLLEKVDPKEDASGEKVEEPVIESTKEGIEEVSDGVSNPLSKSEAKQANEDNVEELAAFSATNSGTRVQETKPIEAIGPDLSKEEDSEEKPKVKVTPPSQLKAEVAVGNQFAIVAASMQSVPSAKKLADDLRQKGYVAEVVVSPVDGKTFYRVVLGRFETAAEAKEANAALGGEYWVTRLSFASQLLSL